MKVRLDLYMMVCAISNERFKTISARRLYSVDIRFERGGASLEIASTNMMDMAGGMYVEH